MKLHKLGGTCDDDDCPTMYLSDRGSIVVQGLAVGQSCGLPLADNENAVEVPVELLRRAVEGLA
ncbi:hypothetical protein F8178_09960 [Haloechinothrix sp. LS1_15]|nr:hypothetical protein [Haloechinothrix sp. LS1_15]